MKVVVLQAEAIGGEPKHEVLIQEWKNQLDMIDGIDEVVYHKGYTPDNIDEYIGDADAVLGLLLTDNMLNEEFLDQHPNLKYVATFAHGFGEYDHELLRSRGVTMTNTIYGGVTVAQYAMALLLDICHNISLHDDFYKNKLWQTAGQKAAYQVLSRQIELYEKTFGVLGLGNIGLWAAKMAHGFGMKVIAHSRTKKEGPEYDFIEQVSFDELLSRSDVISIHVSLSNASNHLINKNTIAKMKDGVIIINTARGEIINEDDLIEALNSRKVYAAGLDVVAGEPLKEKSALMNCDNTKITPHIAWAPGETRIRVIKIASENLKNWLEGHPTSVING